MHYIASNKVLRVSLIAVILVGAFTGFTLAKTPVEMYHYWPSGNWNEAFVEATNLAQQKLDAKDAGVELNLKTVKHEDYKTKIKLLAQQKGTSPDLFSYWEGARTQALADAGVLQDLSNYWAENNLDNKIFPFLKEAAMYSVKGEEGIYNIPFGTHAIVVVYNKTLFEEAGIKSEPETWNELLSASEKIKSLSTEDKKVYPFVSGIKNRWPAQYWFDYLLFRTAGPEFRQNLLKGKESFTSPEVMRAVEMWSELLKKDYFYPNAASYSWSEAMNFFVNDKAAMNVIASWFVGNLKGAGMKPGEDFGIFEFPVIDPSVPQGMYGAVDGFAMPKLASHKEAAYEALNVLLNPEVQELHSEMKGSLHVTSQAEPDFGPVMSDVNELYASTPFYYFNFDLTAPPPVADAGLDTFIQIWQNPDNYKKALKQLQSRIEKENLFE